MTSAGGIASELEPLDDEAFLDELFDRAVGAAARGEALELDAFGTRRPHLRASIEETLRTAAEIAPRHATAAPRIEGYSILRELGRGAMGRVWLAEERALGGRPVALKVLPISLALAPRARSRFLAEARAIARVHHEHVVAIHGVIEREELVAYAMEWVDGKSLADLIAHVAAARSGSGDSPSERARLAALHLAGDPPRGRSLAAASWAQLVARIGIDVARALEAVHAAGLVHRDVKPSNVLLRRDGTALLSDFGLVRDPESSLHTATGEFLGTLAFASPEALRGDHERVDARSDLFSLGASLYQALAFEPPFGAQAALVQARAQAGLFRPLRRVDPRLPRDLETIVAKALEPDPARRYASAGELADDLERLLALQPIRARRAGPLARATKALRRNSRAFRASLAGSVLGLVVAGASAASLYERAQRPALAAEHLRAARHALIDFGLSNQGFLAERGTRPSVTFGVSITSEADARRLRSALERYDASLALVPDQRAARIERELIALVVEHVRAHLADPDSLARLPELSESVASAYPALARSLREGSAGPLLPEHLRGLLEGADTQDRRAVGLAAYLYHDGLFAVQAWSALDLAEEPDPLVDGLLGGAQLAAGRPELAYARLVRARDQFPDSATLNALLADAALRLEDFGVAHRALDACDRRGFTAEDSTFERVRGDLAWAEGNLEEARASYLEGSRPGKGGNPVLVLHLAQLEEHAGEIGVAWAIHVRNAHYWPTWSEPRQGVQRCAEAWWSAASEAEREQAVRAAARDDAGWPASWNPSVELRLLAPTGRDELARCGLLAALVRFEEELRVEPYAPPLPERPPFLASYRERAVTDGRGALSRILCTRALLRSSSFRALAPAALRERSLVVAYRIDRAFERAPAEARALQRALAAVLRGAFRD